MGRKARGTKTHRFRRSTVWRVAAFLLAGVGWISTFLGVAAHEQLIQVAERVGLAGKDWLRWVAIAVGLLILAVVYAWQPMTSAAPTNWTAGWGKEGVPDDEGEASASGPRTWP